MKSAWRQSWQANRGGEKIANATASERKKSLSHRKKGVGVMVISAASWRRNMYQHQRNGENGGGIGENENGGGVINAGGGIGVIGVWRRHGVSGENIINGGGGWHHEWQESEKQSAAAAGARHQWRRNVNENIPEMA
jgi:hypothetical protein